MDDALFCLNLFQGTLYRKIYPAFHIKLQEIYRKSATTRVLLPKPLVLEEKDSKGQIKRVEVAQYREPILPIDFQIALKEVHLWNHYQIEELFTNVCAGERPVVEKSIEAVFAYATKLACASANIPPHLVSVSIPDSSHFVHAVLVEVCRRVYQCPWIIHTKGIDAYQQYQMQLEPLVQKATITQIERMLPTANILHNLNYGGDYGEAEEQAAHEEEHAHQEAQAAAETQSSPLDLSRVDLNYQFPSSPVAPTTGFAVLPSLATVPTMSTAPTQPIANLVPNLVSTPSTTGPNPAGGTTTTVTTVTENQPSAAPASIATVPVITNPLITKFEEDNQEEEEDSDEDGDEEENTDDKDEEKKVSTQLSSVLNTIPTPSVEASNQPDRKSMQVDY